MDNPLLQKYKKLHNFKDSDFTVFQDVSKIELHSGSLLTDADKVIDALHEAKDSEITIHPDYDVDGVAGGMTGKVSLDLFGFKKVNLYYPKTKFGYGLNVKAVDEIIEKWPNTKYILTIDNGINTKVATDYAYEKGIKVIVTDHHEPKDGEFPDKAIAVVNPNRIDKPETYPFKGISGTEVVWKIMQAYADKYCPDKRPLVDDLEFLSGISIISDVMPVLNENRRILRETYEKLSDQNYFITKALQPGVCMSYKLLFNGFHNFMKTLRDKDLIYKGEVTYDTIGFVISPILNAPRRMVDSSELAFKVFTTFGVENQNVINELCQINASRKEETSKSKLRFKLSAQNEDGDDIYEHNYGIVFYDEHLRPGIAGLVSSFITEQYHVPSVALGEGYHGSGRSPLNANLFEILEQVEQTDNSIFKKWGGHQAAAGVTLNKGKLDEFEQLFNDFAKENKKHYQKYDHLTSPKAIDLDVYDVPTFEQVEEANKVFDTIKPYSSEVPSPQCEIHFTLLECDDVRFMGKNKEHVKFTIDGFNIIAWGQAEKIKELYEFDENCNISMIGELSTNVYNGYKSVQLTSQFMSVEEIV